MICTTEEAKKKICPLMSHSMWDEWTPIFCIADECMWWELDGTPDPETFTSSIEYCANEGSVIKRLESWIPARPPGSGWCLVEKFYDATDGVLKARYERELDPHATGYCGATGGKKCCSK